MTVQMITHLMHFPIPCTLNGTSCNPLEVGQSQQFSSSFKKHIEKDTKEGMILSIQQKAGLGDNFTTTRLSQLISDLTIKFVSINSQMKLQGGHPKNTPLQKPHKSTEKCFKCMHKH